MRRYGQQIVGISDLQGVRISVDADETIVPSKRAATESIQQSSGLAIFARLQLGAKNRNVAYPTTLIFTSSTPSTTSLASPFDQLTTNLSVTFSACNRGMTAPKSGFGACESCDVNKYVLAGENRCRDCEDGATCESGAACSQLLVSDVLSFAQGSFGHRRVGGMLLALSSSIRVLPLMPVLVAIRHRIRHSVLTADPQLTTRYCTKVHA